MTLQAAGWPLQELGGVRVMVSRPAGWLMAPAVTLVGRLRYAQKFVVVGLILTIPLGVIAGAYVQLQRDQMAFSERERIGVAYLEPLTTLSSAVIAARHSAAAAPASLAAPAARLPALLAAVDAADRAHGPALAVQAGWASARALVLAAGTGTGSRAERLDRYRRAADALLALIVRVGDASNLTLDPELDTYYLMDVVQFRLPVVLDAAAQATDALALAAPAGPGAEATGSVQIQLGIARGVVASTQAALRHDMATVAATTRDPGVRRTVLADAPHLDAALQDFQVRLEGSTPSGRRARLDPALGTALEQTISRTSADAARCLDLLLQQRIDGLATRAERVIVGAVLTVLLAVYLFVGFYLSVVTPLRRMVASLRAVAGGDLTQRVDVDTRDELRFVAEVLNETVAQTRRAAERLTEQATCDHLTGLPNRMLVMQRLEAACAGEAGGWILFVDLDRFKMVNDSAGHESGDDVLCEVAYRLRSLADPAALVGRLAGDEFVLITGPHVAEDSVEALGALVVARLSEPIPLRTGQRVSVGASVGIAALDRDVSTEEVLRRADVAMYEAKRHGRGRLQVYNDDLSTRVEGRLHTQSELRQALESGEVHVYFQPIVDVIEDRITGWEALARWAHPRRGLLAPSAFIEVAEDSGLIVPLGTSILGTACRQLRRWQVTGTAAPDTFVSVNIAALQLAQADFVSVVAGVLADSGVDPGNVCLEITETSLMADSDLCRRLLQELRRLGVRLAIDDFGIGYSSLSHLSRFPLNTLKIDKSFVAGMLDDPYDATIVALMLNLGRSLDLRVVAEGVETIAQRDALRAQGCSTMQGYLFGHAEPADRVSELLLSERA